MKKLFAVLLYATVVGAFSSAQAVPAEMVRIQGGTFMMGSPATERGRDNDEIQHLVTVKTFFMGTYEVTQKEYREMTETSPSNFKGDNLPVERVSWFDAVEYCNKRSRQEGLTPVYARTGDNVSWDRNANGYRLPTEAEWEYACRAGTTTPFSSGSNITTSQANYNGAYPYGNNAQGESRKSTTPVGSLTANLWGLYDMHGNVWEWCWDWYGNYPNAIQTDPIGALKGTSHILRGGCWSSYGQHLRSANRSDSIPDDQGRFIGFRLARNE